MPIYEYVCTECKNSFEVLSLSSDGFKDVECTVCGSGKVKKSMSTFSASVPASSATVGCGDGYCPAPSMPGCASGMCGLN